MHPAVATGKSSNDLATNVVVTMRQMGVMGLPRNYEIFYEALSGSNPRLSLEVIELGNQPTQEKLDQIGQKYFAQNHNQTIVEQARDVIAHELEDIARILRSERTHLERYGQILDQTSGGLNSREQISKDLLQKVAGAMSMATSSTIDHGRKVADTLSEKSAELESVKTKLEEYKRLADTDPLTHIWNRRAFDKQISAIYSNSHGILFKALILADIDRFKEINDRYGHPIGDKILKIIADIFRTSVSDNMFVARTGGEEFALIIDGLSEQSTLEIADHIRILIEQTQFNGGQPNVNYGPITVSMGICMASEAESADDLYVKADRALYRSKVDGRNRVSRFSEISARNNKSWMLYRKD